MKSYKISYYVLYALFAIAIVVIALFFAGGEASGDAVLAQLDPNMWQPAYTDAMLYTIYGLVALAIIATLVAAFAQFGIALKDNAGNAIKSLTGPIVLVIVFVIAWAIGSEEPLNIVGYEGAHNVPFWLKLSDMFIYSIYALLAGCFIAMAFGVIKKKLS